MGGVGINYRLGPVLPLDGSAYRFAGITGVANNVIRMESTVSPASLTQERQGLVAVVDVSGGYIDGNGQLVLRVHQ